MISWSLIDSMHEVAPPLPPPPTYPPPTSPPYPPPWTPPTPPPTSPPYLPPLPPPPTFGSLRSTDGSLRSTRGPAPAPPLNNKTPAVATGRLLCVPPCVCTAFCVYRLACGPLNNKTPAVATGRLLCVPPCVCTAFGMHRLACGPLNNKTPAVATDRLLCVPPCVCTALPVARGENFGTPPILVRGHETPETDTPSKNAAFFCIPTKLTNILHNDQRLTPSEQDKRMGRTDGLPTTAQQYLATTTREDQDIP